jgi:hypothetical protein
MFKPVLAFAVLIVVPVAVRAQISLVHVTSCGPQTFPTSTCVIPATGTGNTIVVGIQMGSGISTSTTIAGIADSAGNNYAEAGAARSIDSPAGSVADIWYAKNSKSGATTVTVSPSATITGAEAVIWEFSGVDTAAPLDAVAVLNSQAASTTLSGAPVTTASVSEVIVSLAVVGANITGIATGNTFVNDSNLQGNGWAHLITTTTGTFAAQWNQNIATTFASSTVSFKGASGGSGGSFSACDLNQDGATNVIDVQLGTNMYLGLRACTANIAGAGVCSPLVVQQIRNAALGSACVVAASHTVTLNWTASTTPSVSYNVYRSSTSGGPYTKLTSTPISALTYIDNTVVSGQTDYYVTTAVNSNGESGYSNEAPAVIPFP